MCTLQQHGVTRGCLNFSSISGMIDKFGATCYVLENMIQN